MIAWLESWPLNVDTMYFHKDKIFCDPHRGLSLGLGILDCPPFEKFYNMNRKSRQRRRSERAAAASAAAGQTEAAAATLDSKTETEAEQVGLAGVTVARREIRGGEGA